MILLFRRLKRRMRKEMEPHKTRLKKERTIRINRGLSWTWGDINDEACLWGIKDINSKRATVVTMRVIKAA